MTKLVSSTVLDAALNAIRNGATVYHMCSAAPANYAGVAAVSLGSKTITSAAFGAPQAGDVSGRKCTVLAISGIPISTSGNLTNIALVNPTTSDLLFVTEISNVQAVVSGNTGNLGQWDIEFRAPT